MILQQNHFVGKRAQNRNLLWSSGHIGVRCLRCGDSQCDYYAHDVKRSNAGKGVGDGGGEGWGEGRGEGREEENQGLLMAAAKHSSDGVLLYHITHIRSPKTIDHKKERERGLGIYQCKCSLKNMQNCSTHKKYPCWLVHAMFSWLTFF